MKLCECAPAPHTARTRRARHIGISGRISQKRYGRALALAGDVVWFLEKQDDLLVCEIRKTADETTYEFEIAAAQGPITHRFDSPKDLINKYLTEQARLMALGWRPSAGNIEALE
jgi:hypothetical protein